jgi:hypothetical protein
MLVWALIFIILATIWQVLARALHKWLNARRLVLADWQGLRITRTELIEGYKTSATRHPLRGLAAWVERDEKQVYVVVEGPDTAIVKISSIHNLPFMPSKLPTAQEFVAAFNLACQRA